MIFRRFFLACAIAGCLSVINTVAVAASPAVSGLVEQARALIREGKPAQAVMKAREAIRVQDDDYRGHYYLALALVALNDGAAAATAIEAAEARAPDAAAKAAVNRLKDAQRTPVNAAEADRALADGLYAKAGRLYVAAWESGALTPAKTLVAAQVMEKQLNDVRTAARMYAQVATQSADSAAADAAIAHMARLKPEFAKIVQETLAQARQEPVGSASRKHLLEQALAMDANNQEVRIQLINDMAQAEDWPAMQRQFMQLHRQNKLLALLDTGKLQLGLFQQHEGLNTLLLDIWGPERSRALIAKNSGLGDLAASAGVQQRYDAYQQKVMAAFQAEGLVAGSGQVFRDCPQCPEMLWLPPGSVPKLEGIDRNALRAASSEHRIPYPFAIGKYELTFEEWDICVAEGACRAGVQESTDRSGLFFDVDLGRGRQPLANVNMDDVRQYLAWIGKKTGHIYRLMTVPEYIYVMHAGIAKGNFVEAANCIGCGGQETHAVAVGSFPPNAWGLHDLIGNVAERVELCGKLSDPVGFPSLGDVKAVNCYYPGFAFQPALAKAFPNALKKGGIFGLGMGNYSSSEGALTYAHFLSTDATDELPWVGVRVVREYGAR